MVRLARIFAAAALFCAPVAQAGPLDDGDPLTKAALFEEGSDA